MIWKGWLISFQNNNCKPLHGFYHKALLFIFFNAILYWLPAQSVADSLKVDSPAVSRPSTFTVDSGRAANVTYDTIVPTTDSAALAAKKKKRHSPLKAALFSAALPGLGQGYNKKYWKIPIVYAGFGGLGYALYYTTTEFKNYRAAYRLQVDEDPLTYGSYKGIDDQATLQSYRDYYKRFVDISAICTAVWYALNIVDAAVDAHLFDWNMNDDINVAWRPVFNNTTTAYGQPGIGVSLRFGLNSDRISSYQPNSHRITVY